METIHKHIAAMRGITDGTPLSNRPVAIQDNEYLTFCFTRQAMVEWQEGSNMLLERESQRFKHSFIIRQCCVRLKDSMSGRWCAYRRRIGRFGADAVIETYRHKNGADRMTCSSEQRYYGAGIVSGFFYPSEIADRKKFAKLPHVRVEAIETKRPFQIHTNESGEAVYSDYQTATMLLSCRLWRRRIAGFKADYLIKWKGDPVLYAYGVHTEHPIDHSIHPFRFPPND